jgi:hypothetical protein
MTTTATVPSVCIYTQQQGKQTLNQSSSHLLGNSPQQPQNQSKIVVLWSSEDGRTQTSVKPEKGTVGAGNGSGVAGVHGGADSWKPLPFQYQIPINKYSTLHSIAVKRSAFKRRQTDLATHRATIAIPR